MNEHNSKSYDFLIVGAGPNGLKACQEIQKTFDSASIGIIDKGSILYHISSYPNVEWHSALKELALRPLEEKLVDLSYHPCSTELVSLYKDFAAANNICVSEFHEVTKIARCKHSGANILKCKTHQGYTSLSAQVVILASGTYSNPNRIPLVESSFASHYLDISLIGKRIAIVGGGNSAADALIHLLPNNEVYLFLRSSLMRTVYASLSSRFHDTIRTYQHKLHVIRNSSILSVSDEGIVKLSDERCFGRFDSVFLLTGFNARSNYLEASSMEYVYDSLRLNASFETSIPNVYAFGSLMSQWDHGKGYGEPTFVHNGNTKKLDKIIDHIRLKKTLCVSTGVEALIIVSHPDDEILFAPFTLLHCRCHIVCLSNGRNLKRRHAFEESAKVFNCSYDIYDLPDGDLANEGLQSLIDQIIGHQLNAYSGVPIILTHNPDGEYGHPDHIAVSKSLERTVTDRSRLYYFDFSASHRQLTSAHRRCLSIYGLDRSMISTDHGQIFLSAYTTLTPSSLYKSYHTDNSFSRRHIDVYLKNRELYDEYPERRYLITEFLPRCYGRTLNVGVHKFNTHDEWCTPLNSTYETIDLEPQHAMYGSKYSHHCEDFLKFSPSLKYNAIVLFGVLGIRSGTGGDIYTLYDNDSKALLKSHEILLPGGRLLLAPDLFNNELDPSTVADSYRRIIYDVLCRPYNYHISAEFTGKCNHIFVLQKCSDI